MSGGFVYLDTSVALAQLLAEDVVPPAALWTEALVSSRLMQYELWTRIHGRSLGESHGNAVRELLSRVATLEMVRPVVSRAESPFPVPLRTLDALHLASLLFLRDQGTAVRLATYDRRMRTAGEALDVAIYPL